MIDLYFGIKKVALGPVLRFCSEFGEEGVSHPKKFPAPCAGIPAHTFNLLVKISQKVVWIAIFQRSRLQSPALHMQYWVFVSGGIYTIPHALPR